VSKRDYYEVLGVGRESDDQQSRAPTASSHWPTNPDRNPDNHEAEEKFKEAAEAYSVLSDRRSAHLRPLRPPGPASAGAGGFDPNAFSDFSDSGGTSSASASATCSAAAPTRRSRTRRGEDVRYDLDLDFRDAVFGRTVEIQVPRMEPCERCKGKGRRTRHRPHHLHHLFRARRSALPAGLLSIRRTCGSCGRRADAAQPVLRLPRRGYQQASASSK